MVMPHQSGIMGEQVFQNHGVYQQAFCPSPYHPLLRLFFALTPIYTQPESRKALYTGTVYTQAIYSCEQPVNK